MEAQRSQNPDPFKPERVGHPEKLNQSLGVDVPEWYHPNWMRRQEEKLRKGAPPAQGNIRIFNESDLPPELRAIQRGARDPGHFEITPRDSGMSPQRYQELLNAFGKELEEDPE
jgi:hypothetical protein